MVNALCVRDALHKPLQVAAAKDGIRPQSQAEPLTLEDIVDEPDYLETPTHHFEADRESLNIQCKQNSKI